ncbi:unnamed protein product [Diabrotica balteata]|uniref:Dipeptidylpeptidase IV N-terminal domain-containing protein n=1 Tax=Diabrotica balteata TaxID=107213 RepID=A0A9N9TB33_DIABA|nr:unnamed protein product [Diabrotica balteata]
MTETASSTVNGSSNNMDFEHSNQDLIIFNKRTKRRKYLISGFIVVLIIILAVIAVILFSKDDIKTNKLNSVAAALTLEDYLNGKFQPRPFNATWTSNDQLIYSDNGNVVLLDLKTNTSTLLLNSTDSILLTAFDFRLSADGLYLLVALNYQKLFRHSFIANYVIIELSTGTKIEAIKDNLPAQLVLWSPMGNGFVYVKENNIYYKESAKDSKTVQITSTAGYISNGVPDWVYEEEVLSSNSAIWFSKDGKKIAYGRYNDTEVPLMVIPIYGEPGKLMFQYPRANVIKYPKSGTHNPVVSLYFVNLVDTTITYELTTPDNFSNENILSAVEWANDDVVTAIWMNRVQNEAVIVAYNTTITSPTTTTITQLKSQHGWLELFTPPIFSKNGESFVIVLSQDQGKNSGGYRHIFLYPITENAEPQVLTSGKFVVTSIVGWNYEKDLIYYLANTEEDSTVQHLYTVSPVTKYVTCLSCELKSRT